MFPPGALLLVIEAVGRQYLYLYKYLCIHDWCLSLGANSSPPCQNRNSSWTGIGIIKFNTHVFSFPSCLSTTKQLSGIWLHMLEDYALAHADIFFLQKDRINPGG